MNIKDKTCKHDTPEKVSMEINLESDMTLIY